MNSKKKVKIGITGPISEVNFGDYAMLINNIYNIGIKEVTVFSYNKGFSKLIVDEYCQEYNIEVKEVLLKNSNPILIEEGKENSPRVGVLPFRYPTLTPLDILLNSENYDEIYNSIKNIDVLIVNGGGYFNHLWNNSLWRNSMLQKIVIPILIANQQNKSIVFTGNSFGPFDDSEEFFFYFFHYLKNVTFAVRDTMYSKPYLNKLGIPEDKIFEIPDDLFFINKKLLERETKSLVLAKQYIVVELYYSLDFIKEHIEEIRRFSSEIYNRYKLEIVFLPFDLGRGGTEQGKYLDSILVHFHFYDITNIGYLPIQDVSTIIKNAKLVLCTRYHAAVLSIAAKTPVINIVKPVCNDNRYYFNKTYGLLRNVFKGLPFNEMTFMKNSLQDALEYIINHYETLVKEQKILYNSKTYQTNTEILKKKREEYFNQNIIKY